MFMNENYINYCINVDGKIITRSVTKKFFLVIFEYFINNLKIFILKN